MSAAITWNGLDDCRELFASLRNQTSNPTDALNAIGHELTESTKSRIADEKTTPDGMPWKPLTDKYARRKRRFSGGGLLVYTGNLLQSMTYNVSPDKVTVGTNEEYAVYVNAERAFLGVSSSDRTVINQFIRDALDAN